MRLILAVLVLFGVLAGCSEDGTGDHVGSGSQYGCNCDQYGRSRHRWTQHPCRCRLQLTLQPRRRPLLLLSLLRIPLPYRRHRQLRLQWLCNQSRPQARPGPRQALPGTWRGLLVAPEDRCSPYDSDDYPYNQSVEQRIVEQMNGLVYGPYTGTHFEDTGQTDIEHIVARSEAHDSGLCAADAETKKQFASDLLNLTLAGPEINRQQKSAKDAAEWLPDLNQCWFADRVVQVRQVYKLTIDETEAAALETVLSGCSSVDIVIIDSSTSPSTATPYPTTVADALAMYDDNGNGRISCAEARAHGIAPVRADHPAYPYMNDADGDGVVCE